MATVVLNETAQEEFFALPLPIQDRVTEILVALENWPSVSGVKTLRGDMAGYYRKRTGDYRILFRASDRTAAALLTVVRLGHRKDVYDE